MFVLDFISSFVTCPKEIGYIFLTIVTVGHCDIDLFCLLHRVTVTDRIMVCRTESLLPTKQYMLPKKFGKKTSKSAINGKKLPNKFPLSITPALFILPYIPCLFLIRIQYIKESTRGSYILHFIFCPNLALVLGCRQIINSQNFSDHNCLVVDLSIGLLHCRAARGSTTP